MRASLGPVYTLLWLALLVSPAFATEPGMWMCDGKYGLCRYVHRKTKQEIIPARFERGMAFSEGLAAVSLDGRFGYVDERGEIAIEPRFDRAGPFRQGLAEVIIADKAGVINQKGEIVVAPMFRRAVPLSRDVILAVEGTWSYGDWLHEEETTFDIPNAGLYHRAGYWIRRPDLRRARIFNREGRGLIWASDSPADLYGLLASDGEWVIRPEYEYGGQLLDGRAIVRKRVDGVLLSGAIDGTGQLGVPFRPWGLFYWMNGWGVAQESYQGGKQALLDRDGNIIGGRFFDRVERAEQGDVSKVLLEGKWVGIDRSGHIVRNPDNGKVVASCPNGVRAVAIDGKVRITDADGRPTAAYLFEPLLQKPTCDKPFSVTFNGLYGFVGLDGRLLFDPPPFKNQTSFENGVAAVNDGVEWRFIDGSGRFVSPVTFEKFLERRGELFHVVAGGRELWLTATGEERPVPAIRPAPGNLNCGHGLQLVEHNGLWGIADADGTHVIAPRYRALDCFRNGVAFATIDARRQWCAIGPDGMLREKPSCQTAHYPIIQTQSVPETFDNEPFENSVLWSRAYLEFAAGHRETPPRWIPRGR
jgi:WG containing repeat